MNPKVQQQLLKLHCSLEKEFKELNALRNELIEAKRFDLAEDISRVESDIHDMQRGICRYLDDTKDYRKTSTSAILRDNVD